MTETIISIYTDYRSHMKVFRIEIPEVQYAAAIMALPEKDKKLLDQSGSISEIVTILAAIISVLEQKSQTEDVDYERCE